MQIIVISQYNRPMISLRDRPEKLKGICGVYIRRPDKKSPKLEIIRIEINNNWPDNCKKKWWVWLFKGIFGRLGAEGAFTTGNSWRTFAARMLNKRPIFMSFRMMASFPPMQSLFLHKIHNYLAFKPSKSRLKSFNSSPNIKNLRKRYCQKLSVCWLHRLIVMKITTV